MRVETKFETLVPLALTMLLSISFAPNSAILYLIPMGATVSDVSFGQLDWYNPFTGDLLLGDSLWGQLAWNCTSDPEHTCYLNLYVSLTSGGPGSWVIQNLPVFAASPNNREATHFDLSELGLAAGTPLPSLYYNLVVDSDIRTTPPSPVTTFANVANLQHRASDFPEGFPDPGAFDPGAPSAIKEDTPAVLLNQDRDVEGVQAKPGECFAAAVARSLDWLNRHNDLGLPGIDQIFQDLKNKGVSKEPPAGQGRSTTVADWIKAKLDYLKNSKKKVITKVWTRAPKKFIDPIPGVKEENGNFIEWLENEVKKGEDVEIGYWWNNNEKDHGSHEVTVVGIGKQGNDLIVKYRVDERQGDPNNGDGKGFDEFGIPFPFWSETKVYIKDGTPRFDGDNQKIDHAISESVEETPGSKKSFGPLTPMIIGTLNETFMDATLKKLEDGEIDFVEAPLASYWIQRWSIPPFNNTINLSYEGPDGVMAYRKNYTGGTAGVPVTPDDGENQYRGKAWKDVADFPGIGLCTWGTFLNAYPEGYETDYGQKTIRYGLCCSEFDSLNPIYATSFDDWKVLNLIYDSLLKQGSDGSMIQYLTDRSVVSYYYSQEFGNCSKITITLRPDVTWADGTPLSAADVYFTFCELPKILQSRDLPPPSWIADVQDILDFETIDPFSFEVLLSSKIPAEQAYNIIGTTIILPKHVWKPIVTGATAPKTGLPWNATTFAPDPNLIGSGPWRLAEYVPRNHFKMVANTPETTINTGIVSDPNKNSEPVASSKGYFRLNPISVDVYADAYMSKINPGFPNTIVYVNFSVSVTNHWSTGSLNVTKTRALYYVDGSIWTTIDRFNIGGGSTDFEVLTAVILAKGLNTLKVTVVVTGVGPWQDTWIEVILPIWVTIPEDITGSYYVNTQLLAPDCKVDLKDVSLVGRAFGSRPGYPNWNTVADINHDYKIDLKDYFVVAKKFGKW